MFTNTPITEYGRKFNRLNLRLAKYPDFKNFNNIST